MCICIHIHMYIYIYIHVYTCTCKSGNNINRKTDNATAARWSDREPLGAASRFMTYHDATREDTLLYYNIL